MVQTYFYARSAGLWAETRGAAEFFCGTSGYPQARTIVIPNAVADTFSMSPVGPSGWDFTNSRTFRLLYVAAPYKHKNHDIIRDIACHARKENIEFHVTLPVDHPYTARLYRMLSSDGVDKMVVNHGHVKADKLPGLYSMADAVFMPSIAEVFSATYLEGMLSQRPVVACDLPFAREILGDAGLLFDPEDVESAIACILRLRDDQEKYKELVARGIRKIEDYGSREEKYQTTVSFLRQVCERSWH